jgi:hypothetical protein
MTVLLVLLGLLVVAVSFVDAVLTTISVSAGGGPLTRLVSRVVWALVSRTSGGMRPSLLRRRSGVLVALATLGLWVALHLAGWALVFTSSERAVLDSTTSAPATLVERLYYVGFVVFTLGVGDFVPGGPVWQVLTVVATFLGLFLVTLAVTYFLSVVSAAVERQALASSVSSLGATAEQIVVGGWEGDAFSSAFVQHLVQLSGRVGLLGEQHLAYPVLHFFVGAEPTTVAPLAVARLDDALLLLEHGVAPSARPPVSATRPVRISIDRYLSSVSAPVAAQAEPPPAPSVHELAAYGVPVVDPQEFAEHVAARRDRRRRLASLVLSQGWDPRD